MIRLAIAVLGLSAAVASGIAAVVLSYLAEDRTGREWLLWGLTIASVAAPLYGTIAALRARRWLPLLVGLVVAAGALLWLGVLADVPPELPERLG